MKNPKITKAVIKSAFEKATEIVRNPRKGLNRPLLRETAKAIETEVLAGYDQATFGELEINGVCKTNCCIAGQVVLVNGFTHAELLVLTGGEHIPDNLWPYFNSRSNAFEEVCKELFGSGDTPAWILGKVLLGLGEVAAQKLFQANPYFSWQSPYAFDFNSAPQATAAKYLRAIASGKVKL